MHNIYTLKTLKSHIKILNIYPYMFRSLMKPSSEGSQTALCQVTKLGSVDLHSLQNRAVFGCMSVSSVCVSGAHYGLKIQGVPLATEPGISLIILTLIKIMQRNRHTLQTHSSSFLTQQTYSCSNFVAISSLVLKLLKKCLVR
jgi:hypothetical protein